jgi:triacylglycerol lipase
MLAFIDMLPNGGGDGKAFEALTAESMAKFNNETPDVPGVEYFSWGAQCTPGVLDPFWYEVFFSAKIWTIIA